MKSRTTAVIAALAFVGCAGAADATTPIDYTKRNDPYSAAESVTPQKQKPATNTSSVQGKRVNPPAVDKKQSPLGNREAAIDVKETLPKNVRTMETKQPDVIEHATSGFNHRPSAITTAGDTSKPPLVAKYQDSLTSASATNMARFPALDRATSAKINRFVFRKNPPETAAVVSGSAVVPAAGGSARPR